MEGWRGLRGRNQHARGKLGKPQGSPPSGLVRGQNNARAALLRKAWGLHNSPEGGREDAAVQAVGATARLGRRVTVESASPARYRGLSGGVSHEPRKVQRFPHPGDVEGGTGRRKQERPL